MSVLREGWTPPTKQDRIASADANGLDVMIGGSSYSVLDGDTIKDKKTGQSFRLEGLTSPEIAKPDYDRGTGVQPGEHGGLEARYNLYSILNEGNFNTLTDVGEQSYGGGAGRRRIARISNDKGQDVSTVIHELGLADISEQTDQRAINATRDGRLEQALFGASDTEQKFGHLKETTQKNPLVFKGIALNEDWYNPDYYTGVAFRDKDKTLWDEDEQRGGFATNPISAAWDTGWTNTKADLGAAFDALGVGTNSEWLQDVGQGLRIDAGRKLADSPKFRVQNVRDIAKGDGVLERAGNTLEWLGVNSAMSIPYMAAIAAPALAAAPFTGGGSLAAAAGLAASSTPALALHAGNVWNQIDSENKDQAAAGVAFTTGLAMTLLDRFALGAILKPSQALTKQGQEIAINHIAKTRGIGTAEARTVFNSTANHETVKFLEHMGTSAQQHIAKGNLIKDALKNFTNAAPLEATTEVAQELTAYLTAAGINGESIGPEQLDEIQDLVLNSAAAGAAIGGGFAVAGTGISAAKHHAIRAGQAAFDPGSLNEWQRVFYDLDQAGNPDGSISDQIFNIKALREQTHNPDDEGLFAAWAEESKLDPYWKDKLADENGKLAIDRALNPINVIETATHYAGRLVKAPLLNWITPDDLKHNPFIRTIVGRTTNNRGIGAPGKHFEARKAFLQGTYQNVFNDRRVIREFGLGTSNAAAKEFSTKFREFGRSGLFDEMKRLRKKGLFVSDERLAKQGLTRPEADSLFTTAQRAARMADTQFQSQLNAVRDEFGTNSKEAKDFEKSKLAGWWWKHNSLDTSKVEANQPAFTKFLQKKIDEALANPNLSKADKDRIKSKSAKERVDDILFNRASGAVDDFSLVEGIKWGGESHRRLLDMSSDPEFAQFASDNVFDTYRAAAEQTAKTVSHLEYWGDGGRDLDFMFRQALDYEINNLGIPEEQARKKLSRLAFSMKNVIDASSSNYNRIQNRKLAGLQRNVLSYLTFTFLPLSAFASLPEFGTVALDLANSKEATAAIRKSGNELVKGLKNTILEVGAAAGGAVKLGGPVASARPDKGAQQDLLEKLGIEDSPSAIFQRLGIDEAVPNKEWAKRFMDGFFSFSGIRGITQVQRRIASSFAVDFAYNRLNDLAKVPEGQAYTQNQGLAYEQLRALGMDVPKMLSILRNNNVNQATLNIALSPEQRASIGRRNDEVVAQEMETFVANFTNERIQNPGAANRPLFVQDPHFAMITLFNGFLSTFTANIVPKLWNDKVGLAIRQKNPTLAYNAFALIALMVALGAVGQWMRDYLKHGESTPWLDNTQLIQRAFLSSGVFGQYEKLADIVHPLYPTRGEGIGSRAGGTITGPTGRFVENIGAGFEALGNPEAREGAALNNFLKGVPGASAFPGLRQNITDTLT